MSSMGVRLNIGCGPIRRRGEIGVDRYQTSAADVISDIFALSFATDSVQAVRLDHILEHLPRRSVVRALLEAKRVLKSGGWLSIGVPDMAQLCQAYDRSDLADKVWLQGYIFGSQTHEGKYHKSGWDGVMLKDILEAAGFVRIRIRNDFARKESYSLRSRAVKP